METEINEEVENEYQWPEAERLGEDQGMEKNIADMATRSSTTEVAKKKFVRMSDAIVES